MSQPLWAWSFHKIGIYKRGPGLRYPLSQAQGIKEKPGRVRGLLTESMQSTSQQGGGQVTATDPTRCGDAKKPISTASSIISTQS